MMKYVPFRKKKSTSEKIMDQITDAASKVTDQATSTAAVVKQHASDSAATIKHQATDTAANLKQQASGTAANLKQQASGTASTLKQQASGTASTLKQQASGTASSLSAHASDTAANLKLQASGTANSLAAQASERMPKSSVNSDQLTKDVKALAMQAATAAVDLLENARDRSQVAVNAAPTREQIGLATTAVAVKAKSANTALVDQAQKLLDLAKQAEAPINTSVAVAKDKSKASVAVAKDKSKVAAKSTADASKNGVAIAIWSTALVAIILYVLMGKERRERTINRAKAAAAEVQELVRDYRGYDADMETGTV